MKKLLILLFSILISFNSYGELKEFPPFHYLHSGHNHFINTDTIKEHKGDVYFWVLKVLPETNEYGTYKLEEYVQGNCVVYRYSKLARVWYKESGERTTESYDLDWEYPLPDSREGLELNYVCEHVD